MRIKIDKTNLADSFVTAGFYRYSIYFIFLLMLVSGFTEFAFLYSDTVNPLIENIPLSIGITALFVGVIEGLNYFGLKSSLVGLKHGGWGVALLIFILIYSTAKTVSVSISIGGAFKAVEYNNSIPYELTPIYKDSIESYYTNSIAELVSSPHELNQDKVNQLQNINKSIKAEIDNIRLDKGNYVGKEIKWRFAKIIERKENLINKNREKINHIISNDSGVTNASNEAEKMRNELKRKLSEIDSNKSKYDSTIGSKHDQAWLIIAIVEFFSFILNMLRTFTAIFKTPSLEDDLLNQERSLKEEERKNLVIARMEKMILQKFSKGRISMNVARSEIGKLYGGNSINAEKFKSMVKNYSKRSLTNLNEFKQD